MKRILLLAWLGVSSACGDERAVDHTGDAGDVAGPSNCTVGSALTGASYDISKSKFAFGSKPVKSMDSEFTRFTGSQGVVALEASGRATAILNAGVAEANVADWSNDTTALTTHVRDYFIGMGVADCQIGSTQILGGSSGRTVSLNRAVDQIPVRGSLADARFDTNDLTTEEDFYWPTVSAEVVSAARALRDQLAASGALATYQAKLPSNAQGVGEVVIHHSTGFTPGSFVAFASYDVLSTPGPLGGAETLSFDAQGAPIQSPL